MPEAAVVSDPAASSDKPADQPASQLADTSQGAQQTDKGQGAPTDSPDASELLTPEELAEVKKIPALAKLHKSLNRAWTQKTQALAQERKALEDKRVLLDALESDPAGAVKLLAERYNVKLGEPTNGQPATATVQTKLAELVGPEAAQALLPVFNELVGEALKPLRAEQTELVERTALREADEALRSFADDHPDFPQYEAAMTKLSEKLGGGQGWTGSDREYLDFLYAYVRGQVGTAAAVVDRMRASAESAEPPAAGVAESRLSTAQPPKTLREAFELAKQGKTI